MGVEQRRVNVCGVVDGIGACFAGRGELGEGQLTSAIGELVAGVEWDCVVKEGVHPKSAMRYAAMSSWRLTMESSPIQRAVRRAKTTWWEAKPNTGAGGVGCSRNTEARHTRATALSTYLSACGAIEAFKPE